MKFLCVLLLIGVCTAFPQDWESWKQRHGKQYAVEEEALRQYIWNNNLKYVTQHNLEADSGKHTFRLGMNKFADMDAEEFRSVMLPQVVENPKGTSDKIHTANPGDIIAKSIDWRTLGYVTPVKDQGACGSCWSFSATGALEGATKKATGVLTSLSEQNLCDCSYAEGNHGCGGGWMDQAFNYIKINGGIDTEVSYPYTAKDSSTCYYNSANKGAKLSSYVDIASGSEDDLTSAVSSAGPVSVAIDASLSSFHLYESGIYYDTSCSSTRLDHGVLAVGYDQNADGQHYWIVKNSWGADWGNNGYIWMVRNRGNQCGIATSSSYPVV